MLHNIFYKNILECRRQIRKRKKKQPGVPAYVRHPINGDIDSSEFLLLVMGFGKARDYFMSCNTTKFRNAHMIPQCAQCAESHEDRLIWLTITSLQGISRRDG